MGHQPCHSTSSNKLCLGTRWPSDSATAPPAGSHQLEHHKAQGSRATITPASLVPSSRTGTPRPRVAERTRMRAKIRPWLLCLFSRLSPASRCAPVLAVSSSPAAIPRWESRLVSPFDGLLISICLFKSASSTNCTSNDHNPSQEGLRAHQA